MIPASTVCALAIHINLCNLREPRNQPHHIRVGIVIVPCEEVHSPSLHLRSNFTYDIEFARSMKIFEGGVLKIFQIVIIERAPDLRVGSGIGAMIGQGDMSADISCLRKVGERKYCVYIPFLLKIVQQFIRSEEHTSELQSP